MFCSLAFELSTGVNQCFEGTDELTNTLQMIPYHCRKNQVNLLHGLLNLFSISANKLSHMCVYTYVYIYLYVYAYVERSGNVD